MSSNLIKHLPALKVLKISPPKIQKIILERAEASLIASICEICLNLCEGNIRCDKKRYAKLKKYKTCLHKLASAERNQKNYLKEKKLLAQKGGAFLPLLLPVALSTLEFMLAD